MEGGEYDQRGTCRDFNSVHNVLFPKLGRSTRLFIILFSIPFCISKIFHNSKKTILSSALDSSGNDVVLTMNFAHFPKLVIGKKEWEKEEPVRPGWGWIWDNRDGRRWEESGSEGWQSTEVPSVTRESPVDSSPRDHSWPQMGDLSSSTVNLIISCGFALACNGTVTAQQPCCNPTL